MSVINMERFNKWKEKHETAWQFIMFNLMGSFTTIVDMGSFALFNFWIFTPYRDIAFSWWLIDYSVANGGLTAFLAFASSYAISQTFAFFIQRKTTFKANNNVAKSAAMYAVMVIIVYIIQLYIPTVVRASFVGLLGNVIGDLAVKVLNMAISMLIQFPVNKWVIMKKT